MNAPTDPIDQLAANLADLWANNPDAYTRHAQYDPWCDTRCPRQGHLAGTRRLAHLIRDGDPAALEAVGLGHLARCGVDLVNTKAELVDVRSDLADTTTTLDTYRKLRVKLHSTISTLTEERDLARELFRGMMNEYADLSDRYSKMCDDYESLSSLYEAEHGEF